MSWDHRFTVQVYHSDGSPASSVNVYATDNGFMGDSISSDTDSDGQVEMNIPTVATGSSISVTIYAGGEEFGPYQIDDNESITLTLSE